MCKYRLSVDENGHYWAQKSRIIEVDTGNGGKRNVEDWYPKIALPKCVNDEQAIAALREQIKEKRDRTVATLDEEGNYV